MTPSGAPAPRRAAESDVEQMVRVLAEAFAGDPAFGYVLPRTLSGRDRRLRLLFREEVARSRSLGGAWTSHDGAGAAVWYPPGRWKPSPWETLRAAPTAVRVFGRLLPRAVQALTLIQEHHPIVPHWYLYALATTPRRQSTGIGSTLMRPVLRECDEQGIPAYLEATTERNRELYLRHGFLPTEPLHLPHGGPVLHPMWREPP